MRRALILFAAAWVCALAAVASATPEDDAAMKQHREDATPRWLPGSKVRQRVRWETPLQQAAARSDLVALRTQLAAGADPNQAGWQERLGAVRAALDPGPG